MEDRAGVETRTLAGGDEAGLREEVVQTLRAGGIVLLPTETVYGLVARADQSEVLARLGAIKERGDKPFARLIADASDMRGSGVVFPPLARRLARRYWPGPLTLVLDDGQGATVGFRVPGLEFVRRVIQEADLPLVATSANRAGASAPASFAEALEQVGDAVDLAVDGGETQLRAASTVVRVGPEGPPQVLREGFLGHESIFRAVTRLIVFVCTGNTCRSPMAEALLRGRLAERLGCSIPEVEAQGWRIASAGTAAFGGGPAAENAQVVMAERGLDLADHSSQPLCDDLVETAERILCLTPGHWRSVVATWPEHEDKVVPLDPRGVPDPIGGSVQVYRQCADHIASRLDEVLEQLDEAESPGVRVELGASDLAELFPRSGSVPESMDLSTVDGDRWLVGGEVRRWSGDTAPVLSAVCEHDEDGHLRRRELGRSPLLTGEAALEALVAALEAWDLGRGAWPRASLPERIESIRGFADAMQARREEIARLLMWEVGKPWRDALAEVDRTVTYVDDTVAALRDLHRKGGSLRQEGGVLAQVRRTPLGVCLAMGPFNYPLNETYTTVIPALAMGNPVVIKLPKLGMLCNQPLLEPLSEHFPAGVVNVISGRGRQVVSPIIQSGRIDVLAFIGSSRVAGVIEDQHPAPYRLTTILGLDAKNPAIVLPCADVELAVRESLRGALTFNGQRCTALKLIFAHRSIADEFAARLARAVEDLPCGMPWEEEVVVTPLPEPGKPEYLASLIEDAVAHGAEVLNPRGGRIAGTLFFPAVVYPVSPAARLYHEEQFGPVVPVVPFDDVDEIQRALAQSPYGQQVSLFGRDPDALGPLIDSLANQVCRINLDRQCQRGPDTLPFTGRKDSAEGTLSVTAALEAFSLPSLVVSGDPEGRALFEELREGGTSKFLGRD